MTKNGPTKRLNLYKILVEHAGSESQHKSIEEYVLAEDDLCVLHYVDKEKTYGTWADRPLEDGPCTIYNEKYDPIGEETYLEKMLRLKGDYFEEDQDYSDSYYDIRFYGWELVYSGVHYETQELLKFLNIAKELQSSSDKAK